MNQFKKWDELSENARETMRHLGNFGPTVNAEYREVKGYTLDPDGEPGKCYYNSVELRYVADACLEVAAWLDARAELAKGLT